MKEKKEIEIRPKEEQNFKDDVASMEQTKFKFLL